MLAALTIHRLTRCVVSLPRQSSDCLPSELSVPGRRQRDLSPEVVCDGYAAYRALAKRGASERAGPTITLAHCWAHVRRQYVEPWYNTAHRHSGIGLLTPHDVHYGLAEARVESRTGVLAAAYAAHPERFVAGLPRPPARPTAVWINKPKPGLPAPPHAPQPAVEPICARSAPDSHAAESGRPEAWTEHRGNRRRATIGDATPLTVTPVGTMEDPH